MQNTSATPQNSDIFSLILRKVVEFSKNNATVEDFAAYVLSNFSLKLNSKTDAPRYSKIKPKTEDIQKHFQQFIPKGEKPKPNMFVTESDNLDNLVNEEECRAIHDIAEENERCLIKGSNDVSSLSKTIVQNPQLVKELSDVFSRTKSCLVDNRINKGSAGGMFSRALTPQNYTSSTESTSSSLSFSEQPDLLVEDARDYCLSNTAEISNTLNSVTSVVDSDYIPQVNFNGPTGAFKPTQKEIDSAKLTFKSAENLPRRRGRKPSKNLGKK